MVSKYFPPLYIKHNTLASWRSFWWDWPTKWIYQENISFKEPKSTLRSNPQNLAIFRNFDAKLIINITSQLKPESLFSQILNPSCRNWYSNRPEYFRPGFGDCFSVVSVIFRCDRTVSNCDLWMFWRLFYRHCAMHIATFYCI